MRGNALNSWANFELAPPEEIFDADAWLVKKCIAIVQGAGIQSWDDAKAYGRHSSYFCATLVVRSALCVSAAMRGLQSSEAQDFDVRARNADRLRVASIAFGQAKERMLACIAVADPTKQEVGALATQGAISSKNLANGRCAAKEIAKARQDLADTLVEKVQENANAIWKQNPTLSKRAMADYLARLGKGQGLSTGTIRQRIKQPKET
ncbi:hypothetical protein [Aliiroseovarius sp. PrR006]|uniref:hypothetical protein n=1 Tax=Aliiroseovarius sp. PrR006 TaxID=2706883 RepID=UPI0013D8990C|nr:hypothetical protein [Aliiroseovarius sp. PrR006]NDW52239.1 hypothetical protein [Aliiroseovarius sp. PrR006]